MFGFRTRTVWDFLCAGGDSRDAHGRLLRKPFHRRDVALSDAGWPKVRSTRCGDLENVTITVEV